MLSAVAGWLGKRGASGSTPVTTTGQVVPQPPQPSSVLSYPPPKNVWPRYAPEQLLEPHADLIEKIRHAVAMPREQFDALFYPVIVRFAAYAHLLPASESHHHCGPGGLLHHSIEAAAFAAHFAEAAVFGIEYEPVIRKKIEARSRVAAALAGLFHDAGKPIADVSVQSPDGSVRWNPHSQNIYEFLLAQNLEHYEIVFRQGRHRRHELRAGTVLERLLGQAMNDYLSLPETQQVIDDLYDAVTDPTAHNVFAELAGKADTASVNLDMKRQRSQIGGGVKAGLGLAMRFLQPIQVALRDGGLIPNQIGGFVWVTEGGVFLRYPDAVKYAVEQLRSEGQSGFPTQPMDIADILLDNSIIQVYPLPSGGMRPTWEIEVRPPGSQAMAITMNALRFDRTDYVFGTGTLPDQIPVRVIPPATTAVVPFPGSRAMAADSEPQDPAEPQVTVGTSVEDMIEDKHVFAESMARSTTRDITGSEADQWVQSNIRAAQYLQVIANGYAAGDAEVLASVREHEGKIIAQHTRVFRTQTQIAQVLDVLKRARCLEPNRDNENMLVTHITFPGETTPAGYIIFTPQVSAVIRALIAKATHERQEHTAAEEAAKPAPPVQSDPPLGEQPVAQTESVGSLVSPPAEQKAQQSTAPSDGADHQASSHVADVLFLKRLIYEMLKRRFRAVKGGLPALREAPLRSVLRAVAQSIAADPNSLIGALLREPSPLLHREENPRGAMLRVVDEFTGVDAPQPEGVFERYPKWHNLP